MLGLGIAINKRGYPGGFPYSSLLDQALVAHPLEANGIIPDKKGSLSAQLVEQPCFKLGTDISAYAQFSKLGMSATTVAAEVTLDTTYPAHLQGIDCDGTYMYWSFTTYLVKSQLDGTTITAVAVPSHSGGICYYNNKIYVATCVGGYGTSSQNYIKIYNCSDLSLDETIDITSDIEYGIGAIAHNPNNGHFYVGNAATPALNIDQRVYEFDSDFNKVDMHVTIENYESYGVESLRLVNGMWYVVGYGATVWFDENFETKLYEDNIGGAYGIAHYSGTQYYTSSTTEVAENDWNGRITLKNIGSGATSTKYDELDITDNLTGMIRFKGVHPLNIPTSYMRILRTSDDKISLFYTGAGLNLKFTTTQGTAPRPFYNNAYIIADTWYNFGFTYNKTTGKLKLFVDGVKVDEEQRDQTAIIINGIWQIGQPSNQFDGEVSDVKIYNTDFTEVEMLEAHTNNSIIHEDNLKLWAVHPSSNRIWYDLSGNHHDGSLLPVTLTADEISSIRFGKQDFTASYHAFGMTENGDNYFPYDRLGQKCKDNEISDTEILAKGILQIGGIVFNNESASLDYDGATAIFSLNEINSDGTTIYDLVGTNDGTSANTPTFVADQNGVPNQAMSFDGTGYYVILNTPITFTSNNTLSWWSKLNEKALQGVVGRNLANYAFIRFGTYGGGDELTSILGETNTDSDNILFNFNDIGYADFHHFVITQGASNDWTLYIDGVAVDTDTTTNSDLTIAVFGEGRYSTDYFDGSISDLAIYNKALTSDEVFQLYLAGRTTTPKLQPYSRQNIIDNGVGNPEYWKEEIQLIESYDPSSIYKHDLDELTNGDYIRVFGTQLLIQRLFLKGYKTDSDWTAIQQILNYSEVLDATERQRVFNYLKDPSESNQEAWEIYQGSEVVCAYRFDQPLSLFNNDGELCELGWEEDIVNDDCSADNVSDWTAIDCSVVFDTDHYVITYIANTQHFYRSPTIVDGQKYKLSARVKDGTYTGATGCLLINANLGSSGSVNVPFTTTSSWQTIEITGIAGSSFIYFDIYGTITGAGNFQIKDIKLEKVGDTVAKVLDVGSGGADGLTYYNLTQSDLSKQSKRIAGGIELHADAEYDIDASCNGMTCYIQEMDGTFTASFIIADSKITASEIYAEISSYEVKGLKIIDET